MDKIHYAGDLILTGTAIAHALLEYAEALAKSGTSATVDIPVRLPDGELSSSRILIGPASQVVSDTEPGEPDDDEIIDDELVAFFQNETLKLQRNHPHRIGRELDADESSHLPAALDDY